ncbi:unnamed protein product [Closterium sp. NIES-54]
MPQQLREWYVQRGASRSSARCPYVIAQGVDIFALDHDAILTAMYALSASAKGDCYRCVPPDPGIAAAALSASESGTLPGTAPAEALHTFTLDSSALRCSFVTAPPSLLSLHWSRSDRLTPQGASSWPVPPLSSRVRRTAALQDAMATTTTPGGQRVSICTCTRTGRHLATFTRQPGSSLYTIATELPQVDASAQVCVSGQVAASCSCRLLSHQTLLWHHRLGHPSLPCLRGMHSRLLVSGLPRCPPPLPPSPAPPCLPCVEGRQRAAPHSSSFSPTTAPLQTLHMDVWGPAYVSGQGHERYFLLVVDDYTRYTTVFPLRNKGEVIDVLIPWIRTVRLQLCERFGQDLPVLRLHSDRGDSPQQNGIAERRIGLVMEVARTSMIHAAAPHFLWPFAVRYAAHELNLWPHVSLPENSPTLRWTGEVGDASVFRVWGSRAFVRDTSADKLSARAIPYVFLGSVHDVPGWQFYHPPPLAPCLPFSGCAAPGAASGGAASGGAEPGGAESEGAGSWGAAPGGEEPGGVEPARVATGGVEPGGAESEGAESGATRAGGAGVTSTDSPGGARTRGAGAAGTGGTGAGDVGARGAGVGGAGEGGAGARGAEVGGAGAGGAGAARAGAVDPGARGAGGTVRPRPNFVPLLQQVLGVPSSTSLTPPLLCPPPDLSQPPLLSASPLPAPSPYTEQTSSLTERREPASCPVSPVCTARRIHRSCPPPVPSTHAMAIHPSSVPLRVPLPTPPESSLPEVLDPESNRARVASPTVSRLLVNVVSDPFFESAAASALFAELLDFATACRLDYATALVAASASASPPSVRGECALGTGVLEDRQEDFECLASAAPRFASMLLAPEGDPDAPDIPHRALTQRRLQARYVARGFSQQQGVDYFQTFAPTSKMTALRVLLHVAAQRDYELRSLDFSTAFLHGSLHKEIWPHRPLGFTGTFPAGTQWSLRRPVYSLRKAPREWHDTLRTTLAALGFAPSTADPSLFLRTNTSLLPFYVLVYVNDLVFATADTEALTLVKSELQKRHTCTDLGEQRSYLVGCLMYLMTCTRPDLAYPLSLLARYVAPGRHRKVHWDAAKRVLRYLCSMSGMEDGVQLSSMVTQTLLGLTT